MKVMGGKKINLNAITISIVGIVLLCTMLASATTSEISSGMEVVANNGGAISGVSTPTSTSLCLGDSTFTRDFNKGEIQEFDALFANEDNTLGTASAARYSKPGSDPSKSYALLPFKAPDSSMNLLLLSQTVDPVSSDDFKKYITAASATWNTAGGALSHSRTFFGSVNPAPSGTQPLANDGKFVQSFSKSSGSWLASSWLTWSNSVLTDSDVIYNTRYAYSVNTQLTQDPTKQYVDLQSVATHELGHAVGLDDIYNKPKLRWDMSEIMNAYVWGYPRYDLGLGDKAGLNAKYG